VLLDLGAVRSWLGGGENPCSEADAGTRGPGGHFGLGQQVHLAGLTLQDSPCRGSLHQVDIIINPDLLEAQIRFNPEDVA